MNCSSVGAAKVVLSTLGVYLFLAFLLSGSHRNTYDFNDLGFPAHHYGRLDPPATQSFSQIEESLGARRARFELIAGLREDNFYREFSQPVGRLEYLKSNGEAGYCTTALIYGDRIITNYHCIPGFDPSAGVVRASLLMNYLKQGEHEGVERYEVAPRPLAADQELDVAILAVQGRPSAKFGFVRLAIRDAKQNESLFIVHHPGGMPKRLTRFECKAAQHNYLVGSVLRHRCDTLPGSSGALIFSLGDRRVVALHRGGGLTQEDPNSFNQATRMEAIMRLNQVAALIRVDPVFEDRNKCNTTSGDDVESFQADHQVVFNECRVTIENQFFLVISGVSLHARLVYQLDLTKAVTVEMHPGICGSSDQVMGFAVTPATLVTKRVFQTSDGNQIQRDDVPLFGSEDKILRMFWSSEKAQEVIAAINQRRDVCQGDAADAVH